MLCKSPIESFSISFKSHSACCEARFRDIYPLTWLDFFSLKKVSFIPEVHKKLSNFSRYACISWQFFLSNFFNQNCKFQFILLFTQIKRDLLNKPVKRKCIAVKVCLIFYRSILFFFQYLTCRECQSVFD